MNSAADRSPADEPTPLHLISLIDLTNLDDDCTVADIELLCRAAVEHRVAGVCVWPDFVALAAKNLRLDGIPAAPNVHPGVGASANSDLPEIAVVTVVNFPTGDERPVAIEAVTERCLADGATEIDVVLPYRRFLAGDVAWCQTVLGTVRQATDGRALMKVILETGELGDRAAIRAAADLAITCGADFLKTSTGKSSVSATVEAVETLAESIDAAGRRIGIKPSGGISSGAVAREYVRAVESRFGDGWTQPATFRFGASGLLQALLDEH